MALTAREATGGGPAAVAVHDAGDVTRDAVEIDRREVDVRGRIGEMLLELVDIGDHLDLHDLGFFGLQELVDATDVLVGVLLDLGLLAADVVL